MKKALITGITGQDGSYLAEFLLEKGCEVHGLLRRTSTSNTERIDHLIAENKNDFFKNYQNVLMIPSYHDLNNENSYHMMMLGMCLCLSDNYKVIYNREEGKERCDLIIQAHDEKKTSFIIEFKYFKEDKKRF